MENGNHIETERQRQRSVKEMLSNLPLFPVYFPAIPAPASAAR
jgi:hypothetical protein